MGDITVTETKEYANTINLLTQQMTSRLMMAVDSSNYVGKSAQVVQQEAPVDLDPVATRNAPTNYGNAVYDARWVFPADYDKAEIIDDIDIIRSKNDLKTPKQRKFAAARARRYERTLATAFFADAKTGDEAGTTTSFLAGNQVSVTEGASAATGMNLAKLLKGKQILKSHYAIIEGDEIWCAMSSLQELNLFKEVQVTSRDFSPDTPLGTGSILRVLDVNILLTEELPVNGSSYRRCPMWVRRGMHLGRWMDKSEVFRDPSRKNNWAVQTKVTLGATRTEEKLVVEIPCSES